MENGGNDFVQILKNDISWKRFAEMLFRGFLLFVNLGSQILYLDSNLVVGRLFVPNYHQVC